MSGGNPWLQRQRKSDLIELAERVGLDEYVHINLPFAHYMRCLLLHVTIIGMRLRPLANTRARRPVSEEQRS
jgi:hypothetical protein